VTLSVATIVVAHEADEFLAETLSQLKKQNHPIQQVMVVDTANSSETAQLVSQFNFSIVQPGSFGLGGAIDAGIAALSHRPDWLWILHDDSAPEPDALKNLTKAAETSPSVAIVGPKLLCWDLPIEIQQMGLTLTKTARPFLLVESEYDQGQFDVTSDTLAVSTAGMLVSHAVWNQLGGLDDSSPLMAQDIEFSIKARAAGYRVIVEASARVLHAGLSMNGKRRRSWLRGSYRQAISKAHIHLATIFSPGPALPLVYLALPIIALASVPYHLVQKKPGRIFGQISGAVWAWLTLPARLGARRRVRSFGSITGMRELFARPSAVRQKRNKTFEYPPEAGASKKGFFASGAFYLALLLPLVAINQFPSGALSSPAFPLGRSFESIWSVTGGSGALYLEGFSLPSNPFNWIFSLFALLSPSPSLSASWFVFLSLSLAFLAVWLLLGLFTESAGLRNLLSLAYVLAPPALSMQAGGALVELAVVVVAPLCIYFLLQSFRAFNSARSWRWAALAGISGIVIALSSPVVFFVFSVLALVLSLRNPRKFLFGLVSLVPGYVFIAPWLLASWPRLDLIATTSASRWDFADFSLQALVVLGVSVLVASLAGYPLRALSVSFLLSGLLVAQILAGVRLAETDGLAVLGSVVLLVSALSRLRRTGLRSLSALSLIGLLSASTFIFAIQADRSRTIEELTAPALVVAQADVDSGTRTLFLSFEDAVVADLVWGDGRSVDERSVAYEALRPSSTLTTPIANLTAQLVAGNSDGVRELLELLGVDFVVVEGTTSQSLATRASISGMPYFQVSGESRFGALYRVNFETSVVEFEPNYGRDLPLGVLAAYLLLAVPTPATALGRRRKKSA
jgi:GT2 family glycosyltransferase